MSMTLYALTNQAGSPWFGQPHIHNEGQKQKKANQTALLVNLMPSGFSHCFPMTRARPGTYGHTLDFHTSTTASSPYRDPCIRTRAAKELLVCRRRVHPEASRQSPYISGIVEKASVFLSTGTGRPEDTRRLELDVSAAGASQRREAGDVAAPAQLHSGKPPPAKPTKHRPIGPLDFSGELPAGNPVFTDQLAVDLRPELNATILLHAKSAAVSRGLAWTRPRRGTSASLPPTSSPRRDAKIMGSQVNAMEMSECRTAGRASHTWPSRIFIGIRISKLYPE